MDRSPFARRVVTVALLVALLIAIVAPLVASSAPAVSPDFVNFPLVYKSLFARTEASEEELVVLNHEGRISVLDPHVAPGTDPVNWQSSSLGWSGVVLGDFNGDGDQEILAMKSSRVQIFDPVVLGVSAGGQWDLSSPLEWYNMHTGDFDGDGRDEIALLRTEDGTDGMISRLLVFDSNWPGTIWTRTLTMGQAAYWDDMATGDANGDGSDDLGLFRNVDNRLLILNGGASSRLHEDTYSFPWLDLEFINTHKVSGNDRSEIVLSRQDVLSALPSLLVFRWNGNPALVDVYQGMFYPYFTDIEGADLNGDGDQEIVMYRQSDASVALASRNPSGVSMRPFEPAGAANPGAGWQNLKAGDLEGDGRDEVILIRATKYRIYDRPEFDDHYTEVLGNYKSSFAVGDIDG